MFSERVHQVVVPTRKFCSSLISLVGSEEILPSEKFKGAVSSAFDSFVYVFSRQQDRPALLLLRAPHLIIICSGMQKMFDQVVMEETWAIDTESSTKVLSSSRDMVFYFSTARYITSFFLHFNQF